MYVFTGYFQDWATSCFSPRVRLQIFSFGEFVFSCFDDLNLKRLRMVQKIKKSVPFQFILCRDGQEIWLDKDT